MAAKSGMGVLPRHVALENVPACFRSSVLAFGADRLQIPNVRREVQVVGSMLYSRDLPPSSMELSIVGDLP